MATPVELAEGVLAEIEKVAEQGLSYVYKTYADSLPDLFADLPWTREDSVDAIRWLVENPRLRIASDEILVKGGPDYLAMFKDLLKTRSDPSHKPLAMDLRWKKEPWMRRLTWKK